MDTETTQLEADPAVAAPDLDRLSKRLTRYTIALLCAMLLATSAHVRGPLAIDQAVNERDRIAETLPRPDYRFRVPPKNEGQWLPSVCIVCRRPEPPVEEAARAGVALFAYDDRSGELDTQRELVLERLEDLGYELRCSQTREFSKTLVTDFTVVTDSYFDNGPDSHVVNVRDRVAEGARVPRELTVTVLTTIYGAAPIGSPGHVVDFPDDCFPS